MKQVVGRVVTRDGRRGIPDLIVTLSGTVEAGRSEVRIGSIVTDDDGRFDFSGLVSGAVDGLTSIVVRVETPASQVRGREVPPLAITPPRLNPGAMETFLIPIAEEALTAEDQGHFVPTGLPPGLSNPQALVKRATVITSHRAQLTAALQNAAAAGIEQSRNALRAVESAIRAALVPPRVATGSGLGRVVASDASIKDASLMSLGAAALQLAGAKQVGKLALTADELDGLRASGDELDAEKVERALFGTEPARDGLIRTRQDLLRADSERRQRHAPTTATAMAAAGIPAWQIGVSYLVDEQVIYERGIFECKQAHVSRGDATPELSAALWKRISQIAPLVELHQAVKLMIDAAARGIVIPGDRNTPGTIAEQVAKMSLGGGAANAPAFFDFEVLGVSFEHLWAQSLDEHVVETAAELHDELTRAGGKPTLDVRGRLFDRLREEAHAVMKAGVHVAESAALAGFTEVPDFDLPAEERRIRRRDHRGTSASTTAAAVAVHDHRGTGRGQGSWGGTVTPPPGHLPPRPPRPVDTPPPPTPTRLRQLVEELDARMSEPYCFEIYAADENERSVNFGVMFTYRQRWEHKADQAGPLVRTLTLAPREEKSFTVRHTVKRSASTTEARLGETHDELETTDTTRDVRDIVSSAKESLGFRAEGTASADYKVGSATSSWGVTRNSENSSQDTRQGFREAVRKAAHDHRTSRKIEISTSESVESSREESGKLVNPNAELAVTYLFFELQRRYRVSEHIHRLKPVILVAQEVPAPHEITRAWLVQYDWILQKALLDESFRTALEYLANEAAGCEIRLVQLRAHVAAQRAIVNELKEEVLSLQSEIDARYGALESATRGRRAAVRDQDTEGLGEKAVEFLFGDNTSVEASRAREDAARDAWERMVRAQQEARDRLAGAITTLEAAMRDYIEAEVTFETNELSVLRLRVHIKQNILHYMQAIWDHEQPDQRMFRLYETQVPRLDGALQYRVIENAGSPPLPPLWVPNTKVQATLSLEAVAETIPLGEIADLDRLLGYRGNYMIFPLKQHNVLTKFMSVPYADNRASLHDPDDAANFTLQELDAYIEVLRSTMSATAFEALVPTINVLYDYVLSRPFPNEEDIIVPSGSLFIEPLPGSAPVLEDFQLLHRAVDVTNAAAEVRSKELQNLRYAARILEGKLGDPDIESVVVADPEAGVLIDTDRPPR